MESHPDPALLLKAMFSAAVAAASPDRVLAAHLPPPPSGRVLVLGAGKASAAMAAALEQAWPDVPLSGLVVTRYGHGVPCRRIEIVEAAHPVPDAAGCAAAARMLALAQNAGRGDLVLCLISGGGSALLSLPVDGVSLEDKQILNAALLRCGASIGDINCVRKHLSNIKGGRLALAAGGASVLTLAISDVPGDRLDVIASGPTVADASTLAEARAVLERYNIAPPDSVRRALADPANETPKPGDPRLAAVRNVLIATPLQSLHAAAAVARAAGIEPILLGDAIEGEARRVAAQMAEQIEDWAKQRRTPFVAISGGETSVTLRGNGRGGRNTEFLLALTVALNGAPGIDAIACDTDGTDGSEDNAGALMRADTMARAHALGLDAAAMLENNDGYSFFAALGDLVHSGPTRTNVNDFRAVLVRR